jgi:acyl dehydratase
MNDKLSPNDVERLLGKELGTSAWFTIDQALIDEFADATHDHQFIHVDVERARRTPFGGTIAHGLLTLSLIVHLCNDLVPKFRDTQMLLNYGFDRVRFPYPVKSGQRVRARCGLKKLDARGEGQYVLTLDVTIEIEGEPKPAVVAEWLSFHVIGSSDDNDA